ncbi:MAG: hydantoinase B/oxoprolinase family protein [Planctomycetota bacterium]
MSAARRARAAPDPARLEVFHHLLSALCEESGALLQRSAISPNIRERRDFSVALFDGAGRLVAQAAHIPVHLGSAGDSVAAVRAAMTLEPGDVVLLNDPFAGGTHLPDLTMVRPIFIGGRAAPDYFAVCRAHHADVGGATPGSMGVATELLAEGLVIPPVRIRSGGAPVDDVLRIFGANVRGADERLVDLQAQESCLLMVERRLAALCAEHGAEVVAAYAAHLMDYAERLVRAMLAEAPRRVHRAQDHLEDDGTGSGALPILLRASTTERALELDFRGTAAQARGSVNANPSIVRAAGVYALRCLCPERLPTNEGLFRCLRIVTEPGSLLDPRPPAAVAAGNVETSQRLVDVVLRALAGAWPERIPAASAGTMSNLAIGGPLPGPARREFAFYETFPGGAGAGPDRDGASGVQTHMTNTANTPIEEYERRYPLRVTQWSLRRGSGGRGRHRGGDGVAKEIEALAPVSVSLLAERHTAGPQGLAGGGAGRPGRAWLVRRGRRTRLPAKGTVWLEPGDRVLVHTPGGGGYGA